MLEYAWEYPYFDAQYRSQAAGPYEGQYQLVRLFKTVSEYVSPSRLSALHYFRNRFVRTIGRA
jgi:hypothetical protein